MNQSFENRRHDVQRPLDREAAFDQQIAKRTALDVLHRDEIDAVRLARFVEGGDTRVLQASAGPRLAQQAMPDHT